MATFITFKDYRINLDLVKYIREFDDDTVKIYFSNKNYLTFTASLADLTAALKYQGVAL